MKFKVIVLCYNAYPWIERCLASIAEQTYTNYDVCIVDDASTQKECRKVIERYPQWSAIFNETNQKQLPNVIKAIDALECDDEDVIVIVDGDDWLFHPRVFQRLYDTYGYEEDVWLTFGQFVHYSTGKLGCTRMPKSHYIRRRLYRKKGWLYSHLKTFKAFLWRKINDEDLRDAWGNYYGAAWDLAAMFPMVEMAGHHMRHIPDILYVYNDLNPLSDVIVHNEEQVRNNAHIRERKPYEVLA